MKTASASYSMNYDRRVCFRLTSVPASHDYRCHAEMRWSITDDKQLMEPLPGFLHEVSAADPRRTGVASKLYEVPCPKARPSQVGSPDGRTKLGLQRRVSIQEFALRGGWKNTQHR